MSWLAGRMCSAGPAFGVSTRLPTGALAMLGGPDGGDWPEALVDKRIWERPMERARLKLDYGQFLSLLELTDQERNVFNMLAPAYRTPEMAEELAVPAPRVRQVKNSVGRKLVGFFGASIQPDWCAL